ncbi:MAG TPA: type 1 glutamine amidotransferase family protein [Bryobacteraceae bacterium]|nr:type 1 glutamine amidotransferase family protein [Bryobacteraceae bacterium]
MLQRTACVFVFDGFADWEPASALAELRRSFGFATKSFAPGREPVVSMGGFRIVPDAPLADFEPGLADILILPGGDSWIAGERREITAAVRAMASAGRPVAAICAATLALAHAGLLDDRLHTSNGAGFIEKHVPGYRGARFYRPAPAVADRGVITASGVAPIAFAAEIFRLLAPERERDIAMYESLYARGLME